MSGFPRFPRGMLHATSGKPEVCSNFFFTVIGHFCSNIHSDVTSLYDRFVGDMQIT